MNHLLGRICGWFLALAGIGIMVSGVIPELFGVFMCIIGAIGIEIFQEGG